MFGGSIGTDGQIRVFVAKTRLFQLDCLDNRQITTAGFVVATRGSARVDGGRGGLDLARVLIICCAADARTIRVHLDGNLGDIPEGTWLSVTGVVQTGSAAPDTGYTPTLTVTDVRRIPAPANTYAY